MKVILYMAISPNGIVARENGEEDFLSHENWQTFIELAKKTGNFIYGRKTYEAVSAWGEKYLEDIKSIPARVVISNNLGNVKNGFEVVSSPQEAIRLLASKGHEEILLSGGSTNNSSFAKENLIDEIILNIEPYMIGKGIPIFKAEEFELNLKTMGVKQFTSGIIQIRYKVLK